MLTKNQTSKGIEMISVNFANRQRKSVLSNNTTELVISAIKAALEVEDFTDNCEVNVTFVSDRKIKEINKTFRNINRSTDVLSFPLSYDGEYDINPENDCIMLGDIIISVEHAINQAETFGHSVEREIAYLTVHSVFHLLGYDHVDEGNQKKIMRTKEEQALEKIGLQII